MCDHKPTYKKVKEDIHNQEHKYWSRRSFLQALGLVGGGSILLGSKSVSASRPSPLASALANSESDRILVLIRLKGGNDGLNTIVPIYDYDRYSNLRPTLRLDQSSLYNLSPDFGLPSFMSDLQSMWGNGAMKVVHGVGYDESSLSHFSGSDIWASTDSNDVEQTGWLGRHFEELYPDYLVNPPEIPPAIQIGSIGNLIFDGSLNNYAFSVANPNQLEDIAESGTAYSMTDIPACTYGDQLRFMRGTTNTTYNYAGVIHEAYINSSNSVDYIDDQLGQQLAIVARMIKGGLGTKVYMVTLNGFDTHANQADYHETLLNNLSNSVKLFFDDLATVGQDENVLAMTFSEFGRRPDENGSQGTDHGAAAPILLFGPAIDDNGFIGTHPSLNNLDSVGNLIHSIDFRQIYASVLQDWLCVDPTAVNQALLGEDYDRIDLGFACESLSTDTVSYQSTFDHTPLYENDQVSIRIINAYSQHTVVKLYNILGQEMATLKNEILFEGTHVINVKQAAQRRLYPGQYIYRISVGGSHYSRSIIIP